MNTQENNILIAEFMNHLQHGNLVVIDNVPVHIENAKYNHSWDWLMPVVEKIELMNKETNLMGVVSLYGLGRTQIKCYKNEQLTQTIDVLDQKYGIMRTYKAVTEFIKWYNKQ